MQHPSALLAILLMGCLSAPPTTELSSEPLRADPDYAVVFVGSEGAAYCGGVLITPDVVMASAHCILECDVTKTQVRHYGSQGITTASTLSVTLDEFAQKTIEDFCSVCATDEDWPCFTLPEVIALTDFVEERDLDTGKNPMINHDFALFRLDQNLVPESTVLPPISLAPVTPGQALSVLTGTATTGQAVLTGTRVQPAEIGDASNVLRLTPFGCDGDSGSGVLGDVQGTQAFVGIVSALLYDERCETASEAQANLVDISMVTLTTQAATGVAPLKEGSLVYPRGHR